jgi:acetate kinase
VTAALLTLNAGQSSVKAALFAVDAGRPRRFATASIADLGTAAPAFTCEPPSTAPAGGPASLSHESAARVLLAWAGAAAGAIPIRAVGHRITHGGLEFAGPVRATPATLATAARYVPLVPLHQPHNLAMVEAVARSRPDLPQVLCFDTAFHRSIPDVARWFALPRELIDEGVVRYGFHGLSYDSIVRALPGLAGGRLPARLVVAHLGAGASLCAVRDGRSVACTLGMTGMDGLPMGTRVGSIDPGALLYLLEQRGMPVAELSDLLWRRSGMLGLSGGVSARMQDLLASPDPRAREAVDFFAYRVVREVGSLAAALGGLDALVFTGGCGERSPAIRAAVCRELRWLGLELDDAANEAGGPRITSATSAVAGWAMASDEEGTIAGQVLEACPGALGRPDPADVVATLAGPMGADGRPAGLPFARNVP